MLPPGFDQKRFDAVLDQFRAAIGADWVFSSEEDLGTYRDFYSPFWGESEERLASAAVAPSSVEEVQKIVRIANEAGVPVYPVSTGRNLGYGGSAPNMSGSVVVDLKRMNRILEVNEKRHFVLVEPGVSYFDLYRHLRDTSSKLWMDCPDPAWGSLVGNSLDRGVGYTYAHLRDHFGAHCGMEVVLPNGEVMRTGMGARDGTKTWQDFRWGFGPYVDGLFSQGNYGIVTKMGFWLTPEPEACLSVTVVAPKYHDIIPLTDITLHLENVGVITGQVSISSPLLGAFRATPNQAIRELIAKKGGGAAAEFEQVANGQAYWHQRITFFGPKDVIEAQFEHAKQKFAVIPGVSYLNLQRYEFPLSMEQIAGLKPSFDGDRPGFFGIPVLEGFMVGTRSPTNPNPSHGHCWLAPSITRDGEELIKAQNILMRGLMDFGIDIGDNAPVPVPYTRYYQFFLPFFISEDPAANAKMREGMKRVIDLGAEHGWLEYRAHPIFQDQIMNQYDFNNNILLRFHETLKDAIDPKGIISPGRYAIWPKSMRKGKA